MVKTTAEADQTEADMGTFPVNESRKTVVGIKNTGDHPLVILGTTTTCGCARATFDKQPAQPGGILQVEIEMTPKESGSFSETITIRCNTDKPIKMRIKGQAEELNNSITE